MNRTCPICSGRKADPLKKISMLLQSGNSLPGEYEVVCCEKCGFVYADVNASQKLYNDYYENFNIHTEDLDIKGYDDVIAYETICEMLEGAGIAKGTRILDIGSGSGGLLRHLQEQGGYTQLWGIDPSPRSIERLAERGINGEVANIFDDVKEKLKNKFELAVSTGVIEHIYDLKGYLSQIEKYLQAEKPYILLLAPDVESFPGYPTPIPSYFNHEHINYFSKASLDNLMGQRGFYRVGDMRYFYEDEPVLLGLYRRGDIQGHFARDEESRAAVEEYFRIIEKEGNSREDVLNSLLERKGNFVVFGSGSYAMQLLADCPRMLDRIEYFVDNNRDKVGMCIAGKQVKSPEELHSANRDLAIAICSMKNSADIKKQLEAMNVLNDVVVL